MSLATTRRAALVAGLALALIYGATAAPDVTFWDVGEFLTAFHTFGIPHPPGTPLFVMLGRLAVLTLAPLGRVLPGSLLSAACAATAGALAASLVARWTSRAWIAAAAAVCAGATSSVWMDATESEVYAASLLLVACMLVVGERAGRSLDHGVRWSLLLAYLFGLAVPLHLSALVAAPTAALLASTDERGTTDGRRLLALFGAMVLAAGAGRVSAAVSVAGLVCLAATAVRHPSRRAIDAAAATALLAALGVSGVVVMLLRARHDPPLDQGHAVTWGALADVVARRQYTVAPLWPRQAPWWIQLANLGEWADWQFALGLDGAPTPSALRTPLTLVYAVLGVLGARDLRRASERGFRATLLLLLSGSVGVAAYLNLRAGPSFGWGVLPADTPHEARERDYFFVLAFWTWGLWAGIGACGLASRFRESVRHPRVPAWAALGLAALPVATNWGAVTRRRSPDAELPRALAAGILASAPPHSVLLLVGDNDTYPLWYVQLGERARPDVTPVTIPLLGAPWYRGELARRDALLPADAPAHWNGTDETLRTIAESAEREGRPLATSVGVLGSTRTQLGGSWTLVGLAWVRSSPSGVDRGIDSAATRRIAAGIAPGLLAPLRPAADGADEWAQALLRCPSQALQGSLDAACNLK